MRLSGKQCYRILRKHNVRFSKLPRTRGVRYPVKITSRLSGVRFRHTAKNQYYSIMDCRLAVALLAWTRTLKSYGIYEVVHMRTYSPGARIRNTGKRSSHARALSIDVARLKSTKYGTLDVKHDWYDRRRGMAPCQYHSRSSGVIRSLVCETAKNKLFAIILTPHFNRDHHDHLHVEIKANRNYVVLK
jgi:hypothetical protein